MVIFKEANPISRSTLRRFAHLLGFDLRHIHHATGPWRAHMRKATEALGPVTVVPHRSDGSQRGSPSISWVSHGKLLPESWIQLDWNILKSSITFWKWIDDSHPNGTIRIQLDHVPLAGQDMGHRSIFAENLLFFFGKMVRNHQIWGNQFSVPMWAVSKTFDGPFNAYLDCVWRLGDLATNICAIRTCTRLRQCKKPIGTFWQWLLF